MRVSRRAGAPWRANHQTKRCDVSIETLQSPRSQKNQSGAFVPMLRLALPVLAGHLLDMMVGFTDTWLTGNFLATAEHLAAMNLTGYLLWFMVSMFSLVSIGTTAMVARFVGAGDWAAARHTTNQAFVIGLIVCCAAGSAGYGRR